MEKRLIKLESNGPLGDPMITPELLRISLLIWVNANFSGESVYSFYQILNDN